MDLPDCWQDLAEFGVALDTAYRFTWQGVDRDTPPHSVKAN